MPRILVCCVGVLIAFAPAISLRAGAGGHTHSRGHHARLRRDPDGAKGIAPVAGVHGHVPPAGLWRLLLSGHPWPGLAVDEAVPAPTSIARFVAR